MKNLVDILEKLKVDDIKLSEEFPIDKGTATIVNFLKDNNFEEILYSTNDVWRDVHKKFNKNKGKKVFEYWSKVEVLRFADMTKDIDKENPIFCINGNGRIWLELLYDVSDIEVEKKEYLKLLNKVFSWK